MSKDKTAIVVHTQFQAQRSQEELDPEYKRFVFVVPRLSVIGRRFHTILITRQAHLEMTDPQFSSQQEVDQCQQWMQEQLRCRLAVGGKIAYI